MLRTLTTRLLATIALALPATLALGQAVEIKRVENYGGSAVVSTDAKNESIVVTALDADKKPVESWTVTTDADGRTTVPAGYNLAAGYVRARKAGAMPDLITPTNVVAGEVVMLCAPRAIEGQTVEIKTLAGEVVASKGRLLGPDPVGLRPGSRRLPGLDSARRATPECRRRARSDRQRCVSIP
jgi:hypothetical protein